LYHDRAILAALPKSEEKKLRSGGGFKAVSALSLMNRHKHEQAGENKPKTNLRKKNQCKPDN
jgi:hypothetical protein